MAQHLFYLTKPATRKKKKKRKENELKKHFRKAVNYFKQPLTQVLSQIQNNMSTSRVYCHL